MFIDLNKKSIVHLFTSFIHNIKKRAIVFFFLQSKKKYEVNIKKYNDRRILFQKYTVEVKES
jgi:hypothetical protein